VKFYVVLVRFRRDYSIMSSRKTDDHSTHEAVPRNESNDGETSAGIFTTIDDETRVIPAIEFRNVNFAYGDQIILNDISFRVMRGELLIVLSASGGGKSTILKLTLGLMKPDAGRILIDGEDITDYDEEALNRVRQRIGVHFQDGALFDSLSVYDNVAFRCHERGVPEETIEQEVRRLLRFVDLEDAIDITGRTPVLVDEIGTVGDQAAAGDAAPGRDRAAGRQLPVAESSAGHHRNPPAE